MDSIEVNKLLAGLLAAGTAFGLAGLAGSKLVTSEHPEKLAIIIHAPSAGAAADTGPVVVPIAVLLAKADPARGATEAPKLCGACHSFNAGGGNLVGPNLYGVIGEPIAQKAGYEFSATLKGKKGNWTFDAMNDWLTDPKSYAPGTKMAFAGIPSDRERADVIDYLRTNAASPEPLPPPPKVTPGAGAQPAGGPGVDSTTPASPSFSDLVAKADVGAGQADTQKYCGACHSLAKGGVNMVGPNLYGVVGQKIASGHTYSFSGALKAKSGQTWSYDNLDVWLRNPREFASGTKMAFAGIASTKQRAAVVAYLRTLSDSPLPLPAARTAPAAHASSVGQQTSAGAPQTSARSAPPGK